MFKLVPFIFLLISIVSFANDEVEKRRKAIIKIINEEIVEVQKLSKQSGNRNPDLLLRLADLNLEKARLVREKENSDYLDIPAKRRSKVNKRKFFAESNRYFKNATDYCLLITRKFKNYSRIGEVYYILGFNAKEENKTRTATKYLSLANKKSKGGDTKIKTQISLAEVYYNEKKYRQAIPLYEKALRNKVDKWWTKDSFNLAWCYFRENRYSSAISKMEEVFKVSSSDKFIDMRAQVERDIGLFYATANKIDRGVQFYKRIDVNFTDQLLKIGVALLNQGKYTRADKVFNQALKYEKDQRKLVEIYIEQLNLHQRFGKYGKHLNVVKELHRSFKKNLLTENQLKSFVFQMEKVAAILQRQAIGKTYSRLVKVRRQKAMLAIDYFEILASVESKRSDEFYYLAGETAYAVKLNTQAYVNYKKTYEISEKSNKNKFKFKSIEGMMAVLSASKSSTDQNIYVFEAYLKEKPRGKASIKVYERLFNNYIGSNNYRGAKGVLDRFKTIYPKDLKQEAMIAKLMDIDRKAKRNDAVRAWVKEIEAGKYFASLKYRRKLQELLTSMQIDDVQGELSKGNKKVALVGYLDILKDPYSTKRSKVNAKYNLAALYFELGDTSNTYRWSLEALKEMEYKDVKNFSGSFITFSNFLFNSLEFEKSANLSKYFYIRACKVREKKKITSFKNAAFTYLSISNIEETEKLISGGKKCGIPNSVLQEIEFEVMREYKNKQNWNRYEYYVGKLTNSKAHYNRIIDDYLNLADIHARFNNKRKEQAFVKMARKLYLKAKRAKKIVSIFALNTFAEKEVKEMEKTVAQIKLLNFSTLNNFKKDFDRIFSKLQLLEKQAQKVVEVGSGQGVLRAYRILNTSYTDFAKKLETTVPTGLKKEHIQAFKKDISAPIKAAYTAANAYLNEAKNAIRKNQILSSENHYFQDNKFPVKFNSAGNIIFMDRGGI